MAAQRIVSRSSFFIGGLLLIAACSTGLESRTPDWSAVGSHSGLDGPLDLNAPQAPAATASFVDEGSADIKEQDLLALMEEWTHPWLLGRDTPSQGLHAMLNRSAQRLLDWGYAPAGYEGGPRAVDTASAADFRWGYSVRVAAPDEDKSSLEVRGGEPFEGTYGTDFMPARNAMGSAAGTLTFAGYGISAKGYDDLRKLNLKGRIALICEGEPRHRRTLDGPEVTPAANLYRKLDRLEHEGAVGALIVRRRPTDLEGAELEQGPPGLDLEAPLEFRHTLASWNGERPEESGPSPIPALVISEMLASQLLGEDFNELMGAIDKSGKPSRFEAPEVELALRSSSVLSTSVATYNIAGWLQGTDPDLNGEYVVIGAHSDHVGVDQRGRVAIGADDNASGSCALLEIARALAADPPRRSVMVCFFGGEEDGLLGSKAVADSLGSSLDRAVAMVNLDMLGRGESKSVVALGIDQNPSLERVLKTAIKAAGTRIKKVETGVARELFERSDHYSFHSAGVPTVFLFEQKTIAKNVDYHTWRDTLEGVDTAKVTNVARIAEAVVRELADADERPPAPRR